ncbi:Bombesin receptor subtype-3 [Holothuria leucospilota]|uniref:Bombesin receptor subtype-3 n=1 Tax=Holothuria leucospilota TaxID=206669 RepID=A0A9Q1C099_HOLLE|nr:Bombesin receptor subtype-3 [Holothuria leucospilota]
MSSSSYYSYGNQSLDHLCYQPMSGFVKVGIGFLVALFIFGILVNISYLVTVLNNHTLRTPPNLLVTNLAAGDLLYMFLSAPFYVEHEIHPCFQFGLLVCKLMNMSQVVAQSVCVYSLMFGAIERYMAITRVGHSGHVGNIQSTVMVIALIWIISILMGTPVMFLSKLTFGGLVCINLEEFQRVSRIHEISRFVLLYVIPLTVITWCYSHIFGRLMKSTGTFRNERQPGMVPQIRARRRVAKMLMTITVFFAVCWLPYFSYKLWFQFRPKQYGNMIVSDLFRHTHFIMALINSCANPVIVYVMSSTHRRALRNTFRRRVGKDQLTNGPTTTITKTFASEVTANPRSRISTSGPIIDMSDFSKEGKALSQ